MGTLFSAVSETGLILELYMSVERIRRKMYPILRLTCSRTGSSNTSSIRAGMPSVFPIPESSARVRLVYVGNLRWHLGVVLNRLTIQATRCGLIGIG
jgi:hypothetical protein